MSTVKYGEVKVRRRIGVLGDFSRAQNIPTHITTKINMVHIIYTYLLITRMQLKVG